MSPSSGAARPVTERGERGLGISPDIAEHGLVGRVYGVAIALSRQAGVLRTACGHTRIHAVRRSAPHRPHSAQGLPEPGPLHDYGALSPPDAVGPPHRRRTPSPGCGAARPARTHAGPPPPPGGPSALRWRKGTDPRESAGRPSGPPGVRPRAGSMKRSRRPLAPPRALSQSVLTLSHRTNARRRLTRRAQKSACQLFP